MNELTASQTTEEPNTKTGEEDVREPDQQDRKGLGIIPEGIGDVDEKEVPEGKDATECKTNRGLFAVCGDAERHSDQRKGECRQREREALADLNLIGESPATIRLGDGGK